MLKRLSGLPLKLAKRLARRVQEQDAVRHAAEAPTQASLTKEIPDEELAEVDPKTLLVSAPRGLVLNVGSSSKEHGPEVRIPLDELVIRLAELPDGRDITVVGDNTDDALRAARFLLFRGFEPGRILVLT